MSKSAEEAALKAFPKEETKCITAFGTLEIDNNRPARDGFIKGYEQAEKDINVGKAMLYVADKSYQRGYRDAVRKACELYRTELGQVQTLLRKINENAKGLIDIDASVSDFRKAMEK